MSDVVYGKNSFFEALDNNRIICAYVLDNKLVPKFKNLGIEYKIVERKTLDKMSKSGNHQGYLATVKEFKMCNIEDIIKEKNGLVVILDGLKDVHNLGAIIRTCECANVDGIIYKSHNSVKVNDTVAKVACGGLEYVKIVEVNNIVNAIKKLKDKGYWIVGTDGKASQYYTDIDYNMNVALVIGSEGEGISRLVKQECDFMVKIPLLGHVNSLNASVAAGILIYNIIDKRNPQGY